MSDDWSAPLTQASRTLCTSLIDCLSRRKKRAKERKILRLACKATFKIGDCSPVIGYVNHQYGFYFTSYLTSWISEV